MMKLFKHAVIALSLLAATNALADCNQGLNDITMPLIGQQMTIGRDLPMNSVIYSQDYAANLNLKNCNIKQGEVLEWEMINPERTIAVKRINNKDIYTTNVPGIGYSLDVVFASKGDVNAPFNISNTERQVNSIKVTLYKTAEVMQTGLLNIHLPAWQLHTRHSTKEPINMLRFAISGGLNVVSQTCKAQDQTVKLGVVTEGQLMANGASNWVDFDINLTQCPAMFGRYSSNSGLSWSTQGSNIVAPDINNQIDYLLRPINGAVKGFENDGVIAQLDNEANLAQGVAVQIYQRNDKAAVFNQRINSGLTLLKEASSYKIPLKARMYKTSDNITSGKVKASVELQMFYQ